ncbi:MAG TPA: hypothetical protein ENN08_00215 [Bacteroidales bacterium]|nr:hypothetical protein [Bacteroidales bacterium]
MEQQELKVIADRFLGENPHVDYVLLTADGQVFLPRQRNAAENHIRQSAIEPPTCFEFTRLPDAPPEDVTPQDAPPIPEKPPKKPARKKR